MQRAIKLSSNYCGQYRSKCYDRNYIKRPCDKKINRSPCTDGSLSLPKYLQPVNCDYKNNDAEKAPVIKRRGKFYRFLLKYICIPGIIIAGIVTKINYDVEKRCREAQMAHK